jgi:hypothetical protein
MSKIPSTIFRPKKPKPSGSQPMELITIQGDTVTAVSPEGQKASMRLADLLTKTVRPRMDTRGVVLPDGVKLIDARGPTTIWAHETPPCIYSFKWIAADSPARYGPETRYRQVRIALPYLIVMAAFDGGALSGQNECFFRVDPLDDESDELLYPALLNCSKFSPQKGKPLSWICTAGMNLDFLAHASNPKRQMRASFRALMRCLLQSGFNFSSEEHEQSSWFTESTRVDPRVSTIEKWQEATNVDPSFVLDVPWLKTGKSAREVIDRMFAYRGLAEPPTPSSADLSRMVFNHRPPKSK